MKKIAIISKRGYESLTNHLREEGFEVKYLRNIFTDLKKRLSKEKFDSILLEPYGIATGGEELGYRPGMPHCPPQFIGKKLLENVIKSKDSLNENTPVTIFLDTPNGLKGFNTKDYLKSGGTNFVYHSHLAGLKEITEALTETFN